MTKSVRLSPTGALSALSLVLLGSLLVPPAPAEAQLFKKLKERIEERREQRAREERERNRPRPRKRSHYRDAHGDAYVNHALLEAADEDAERKVVIDIGRQRAFLVIDDIIAVDSAVSTARRGHYTPRGTYRVTERIRTGKVSTIYHVYMPCWMRLGHSTVGMHIGDLPGYPASAGCIRLPQSVAPLIFENTGYGLEVEVVDSWDEEGLRVPYSYPTTMRFAGV